MNHLLQSQLQSYASSGLYPLHMPGHKRRVVPAPGLPAGWDMTEVPGVDDLHDADGILADAMTRTAALWGAKRTWYLVNGSTCGILAAIRAAVVSCGRTAVICARNCHKSVYHAIELNRLTAHWLVPPVDPAFGIYGSITPAMVADALRACPDAAAVILTSPTYEGVLSDLAAIAALCHAANVPLIVDEAHGAHYLPLAAAHGWQGGAIAAGADVIIQSPHKTLPSLTQTALLHWNSSFIPPQELERQLDVFETSSPSYPLMASLDGCTGLLAEHGDAWFAAWRARLQRFSGAVRPLRRLRVLCHGMDDVSAHPGFFAHDSGKILVNGAAAGLTGPALAELLRRDWQFETEMSCGANVLAMTSPCDEETALDRFAAALLVIDAAAAQNAPLPASAQVLPRPSRLFHRTGAFCPAHRVGTATCRWPHLGGVCLGISAGRSAAGTGRSDHSGIHRGLHRPCCLRHPPAPHWPWRWLHFGCSAIAPFLLWAKNCPPPRKNPRFCLTNPMVSVYI